MKKSAKPELRVVSQEKVSTESSGDDDNFPIIALDGPAGSFGAIERFFLNTPRDTGFAFVIIMHPDPNHVFDVSELLQSSTAMPITEAEDGMPILRNCVYVIPLDRDMGVHNSKLLLFEASRSRGAHMQSIIFSKRWPRTNG